MVDYYQTLEDAFSKWAPQYDSKIAENPVAARIHTRSLEVILGTFGPGQVVLDLGSGTGTDAVALAQRGAEVVATDISEVMLSHLKTKAKALGVESRITTKRMAAADLHLLLREYGESHFDGAMSNFGALNCEPRLSEIPKGLHSLLRTKGRFIASLRNRFCIGDFLLHLTQADFHTALNRARKVAVVSVSGMPIEVRPYSAREFIRTFSDYFVPDELYGLPAVIPPHDLVGSAGWNRSEFLWKLDRTLSGHFPFNVLGDYFLVRFTRV